MMRAFLLSFHLSNAKNCHNLQIKSTYKNFIDLNNVNHNERLNEPNEKGLHEC